LKENGMVRAGKRNLQRSTTTDSNKSVGSSTEGTTSDDNAKGFKKRGSFRASKDSEWHERNCDDSHLILVESIAEAYPFESRVRKTVELKEKIYGGGFKDPTRDNWGKIEVMQLGPPKLSCDPCGAFILNRSMEKPFYVCTNCRKCGHKMEMCVECYAAGVLATGPRKCDVRAHRASQQVGGFRDVGRPVKPIWELERQETAKVVVPPLTPPTRRPLRV